MYFELISRFIQLWRFINSEYIQKQAIESEIIAKIQLNIVYYVKINAFLRDYLTIFLGTFIATISRK